jgi:DNA-binding XRE family transcriptional regulator
MRVVVLKDLAHKLKVMRLVHNITQEELSKGCKINIKTICNIETGGLCMNSTLEKIAKYFDITVKDLISLSVDIGAV